MLELKTDYQQDSEENSLSKEQIYELWNDYFETKNEYDYLSLFIKIPFCLHQCKYCIYFVDLYKNEEQINDYLNNLELQMKEYSPLFKNQVFKSLYIGGGTASLLQPYQMKRLFDMIKSNFNLDMNNNIYSFETSISTLTEDKIDFLADSNFINRVSIGIQSLSPQPLTSEDRFNPSIEIIEKRLRHIINKFKNKKHIINVDLMAGLSDQSNQTLINDFNFLSNLDIPKITVYSKLTTTFHNDFAENKLRDVKINYIDKLLKNILENNKYDYEKDITNENFYNFLRKNYDFNFNFIYFDKPNNINGYLNSVLGLGKHSNSWQGLKTFYRQIELNEYYHLNQFYFLQDSMIENYKLKYLSGDRKIFYS